MKQRNLRSVMTTILSGVSLSVLTSQFVLAQDLSGAFSLDPILVEREDPQAGSADRATAVYVAEAEVEQASLGDLKDLFKGIASVSVGGAIPLSQKIFVNGVDMLNLSVKVDGVLQNNRTFHHVSASAIDPGLLKFVRVDPGVAAADTGPNALAGAVIMETIDAADFLDDGDNFGGKLRLGYSDNGETKSGALTLVGREGGLEWLLYLRRDTGEDYDAGGNDGGDYGSSAGESQHGTAADFSSALAKIAYESDQGHRLEFSAQTMVDDSDRAYRANMNDVIGSTDGDTRVYDSRRKSISLSYENTHAGGNWDPEVVIGFSENLIDVPEPYGSEGTTNSFSATFKNTFHLDQYSTVTAGVDYLDRSSNYTGPTYELEENAVNFGLFAQARLALSDALDVSAGVRYDIREFTDFYGEEHNHNGASGNLSLTYNITDAFSVRAGYSSVFGGIDIEDNYTFWTTWDYSNLKPSRAENMVVGFDWSNGALTFGAEAFRTEINDARSGYSNYDFSSTGYSLGATYGWAGGFARMTFSNSDVEVNGSPTNSYDVQDLGAPLGKVLALEIQQELPQYNLVVGGSLDVAFDYNKVGGYSGMVDLPGYEVVNVYAEYTPPALSGWMIRASVDNLFDVEYWDRATYGGDFDGGQAYDVQPLMEPGRTISVEMITEF